MKLPNVDRAIVEIEKLRDYCLSTSHPRGRHKARVFVTALGITANEAEELRVAILSAITIEEAIPTERDDYGQRYVVDFSMRDKIKKQLSAVRGSSEVEKIMHALPVVMCCRSLI